MRTAAAFAPACWPYAVRHLSHARMEAVPLASVAELEAEGFDRAQVAEWAPRCAAGRLRVFVVREATSGRRVGHFGLRCVVEAGMWVVEFHSIRPDALRSVLGLLAEVQAAYQEKTRGKPHAGLGTQAAVRSLRKEMDAEDAALAAAH